MSVVCAGVEESVEGSRNGRGEDEACKPQPATAVGCKDRYRCSRCLANSYRLSARPRAGARSTADTFDCTGRVVQRQSKRQTDTEDCQRSKADQQ